MLRDPKRGIYKRLVIEQDKIRGAVLYGDVRDSGWYLDLMNGAPQHPRIPGRAAVRRAAAAA